MKKDTYYFSHDYNAHNDVKILFLRQQLGMEGYGIYWFLIESLADSGGHLPLKIIPVLAMQMHTNEIKVKAVIESFELFEITENQFFSVRLLENLNIRKRLSEAGKSGAEKKKELREATREATRDATRVAEGEATRDGLREVDTKERKGKEKKEKEIENKNLKSIQETNTTKICESTIAPTQNFSNGMQNSNLFRQPTVPTLEEVEFGMSQAGGTKEMAKAFFEKYEATGWFLNGSPIVNWKALANRFVANWRTKDQNQPYQPPKTTYVVKTPREDW